VIEKKQHHGLPLPQELRDKLNAFVSWIYDDERVEEWDLLADSTQSDVLRNADRPVYYRNMRAAYLQLLGGAFAKSLGGPAVLIGDPIGSFELSQALTGMISEHHGHTDQLDSLISEYNNAYGSSPTSGARAMAQVLGKNVTGAALSPEMEHALTEHMVAIWQNWITQLSPLAGHLLKQSKVAGLATRRPSSSGCLFALVLFMLPAVSLFIYAMM